MDENPEGQPVGSYEAAQDTPLNESAMETPPQTTDDVISRLSEAREQGVLEWTASEYVEHEKSNTWFVWLGVIALALLILAVFVIKEYTFAALIVVMTVSIVVWARRPAMEMHYQLSADMIAVNDKQFMLHGFRAFGVLQEGAIYYAVLLPIKRFSPGVNVYFPHKLGEQIVDVFGATLPMEDIKPDFIDKLTNRLNF